MNTQDIMSAIQKDSHANRHFIGVFVKDGFQKKLSIPLVLFLIQIQVTNLDITG